MNASYTLSLFFWYRFFFLLLLLLFLLRIFDLIFSAKACLLPAWILCIVWIHWQTTWTCAVRKLWYWFIRCFLFESEKKTKARERMRWFFSSSFSTDAYLWSIGNMMLRSCRHYDVRHSIDWSGHVMDYIIAQQIRWFDAQTHKTREKNRTSIFLYQNIWTIGRYKSPIDD